MSDSMAAALAQRVAGLSAWNHTPAEQLDITHARRNGHGLRITFRDGSAAWVAKGSAAVEVRKGRDPAPYTAPTPFRIYTDSSGAPVRAVIYATRNLPQFGSPLRTVLDLRPGDLTADQFAALCAAIEPAAMAAVRAAL